MKTTRLEETVIIVLTLIPFIYLAIIYGDLPDTIPTHWNAQGVVDGYGNKKTLWMIPIMMTGLIYVLLKFLPQLDPKKQIQKMGKKFIHLRMIMTLFMTLLATGIIYMTQHHNEDFAGDPSWVFILVGLLFVVLGNYMPAMKPNYFVGIRTPWTLENETVWRKTHRLGGWTFMASGVAIIISALALSSQITTIITLVGAIGTALVTMVYSYMIFKKIPQS